MLRVTKRFLAGTIAGFLDAAKVRGCGLGAVAGTGRVLKTGKGRGAQTGYGLMAAVLAGGLMLACGGQAKAQNKLGPAAPVSYANRWEVYGGLNFMNFQAGQNLPKRMNMGGGEISGTYWLNRKWGLVGDYRGEAGTTPILSNPYGISRPLVYMNMGLGGAQYRGPKNQHAAVNFHAYGGLSHGVFDGGTAGNGVLPGSASAKAVAVGLYSNRTSPMFALGGSLDMNQSKNWAIRLSPDLILEHFGTETRVFFAISGGVVYRIGKK
jgi:hypothetical protein